jgi:uncharacterized membrane protein YfcA
MIVIAMAGILCARNTLALWKSNSVNRQLRRALAFFTIIVGWIYITLIDVCIRQTPEEEDYFTVTETRLEPFGISFFIAGFLSGGFMVRYIFCNCPELRSCFCTSSFGDVDSYAMKTDAFRT